MVLCKQKTDIPYWNNTYFKPVENGLVAWYTTDFDSSAVWNDRSLFLNNITLYNTTKTLVHPSGVFGSTLSLNGYSSYGNLGLSSSLNPTNSISVETLAKTSSSGNQTLMCLNYNWESSAKHGVYLGIFNGELSFRVHNGSSSNQRAVVPFIWNDGKYHLYSGTFDGSTCKLFVDGSVVNSTVLPSPILYFNTGNYIGKEYQSSITLWNGEIAEARIYSRGLGDNEVSYNNTHSQISYITNKII